MSAAAPPFGPVRYPRRATFTPPHPAVSIAAALGAVMALWPCGLPRSGIVSGALTALCVGIATTAALVATRRRTAKPAQAVAAVAGAAGALASMSLLSLSWQNSLRTDLGAPQAGVSWLAASIVPAALLFTAIVSLPRTTAMIGATVVAVAAGYLPAAQADDAPSSPHTPAGVIYGLDDGTSLTSRSRDLATRWVDAGGLDLRAVVIAVPTGSGWIDATAVAGYEDRFAGHVAILAIQYAQMPSWRAFVGDRSAAGRSAVALLHEVIDRTMDRPPDRRPRIHLYGQSLGAIGAEEARVWAGDHRPGAVAETLLAGVPGDAVGDDPGAGARRVVLANASDPIPRWSPSLIWRPARQPQGTVVIGRSVRHPPWLPVVGFLQTSTDLLGSLDGAPGVGHRYGQEQSSSMSSTTDGG
ncbi:alpha/beta-hydrolase family protein [Gordonia sp. SL306]|uniref:alpha/beta-hydrolase family protein n=1 Tax=Gordonia sp. SL306 TaxID=2995145 RepID=UPI00226FEA40|nr:alpha/beta-hydrolase family protein [Gordonia sp. SL306]WAC56064.1 alpha/beta-hydrolase family protein [Gordonia sp. SL306]